MADGEDGGEEGAGAGHGANGGDGAERGVGGGDEGSKRKRKMTVRWGRAYFEDAEPEDSLGAPEVGEEAAAQSESDQTPPEPKPERGTATDKAGGELPQHVIRRQKKFKVALAILVVFDVILLVLRFTDVGDPYLLSEPPPSILGTWVTEDPVYAGRVFVISREQFELRLSEDGNFRFDIRSIRGIESEDSWRFEITYINPEEGDMEHVFFLDADGTARMRNEPQVLWTRFPSG